MRSFLRKYVVLFLTLALPACTKLVINDVAFMEMGPQGPSILRVTVKNEENELVKFRIVYDVEGVGRKSSANLTLGPGATETFEVQINTVGMAGSWGINSAFWICVDTNEQTTPKIVKFDYPGSGGFDPPINIASHSLKTCPEGFDGP